LADWNKIFALIGVLLLVAGGFAIARVQCSTGLGLPKGPIWIWVPSKSENPDYYLNRVDLILNLWDDGTGRLDVDFDVSVTELRQFGFAVMQPIPLLHSYSTNLRSNVTDVSKPNNATLENGEFLTTVIFSPKQFGEATVRISVTWRNAISVEELGKREIDLTFYGGTNPSPPDLYGMDTSPIRNGAIVFSVYYPTDWNLSPPDTFPQPEKAYVSKEIRGANWQIDFTRVPSNFAESVIIGLSVPWENALKGWLNFLGAVAVASGAGLICDGLLDFFRHRRRRLSY
jgi:hypothetical protein